MKKCVFSVLFVLLLKISAYPYIGEVARSLGAPAGCPTGIAFDGKNLWSCDRKTDTIYKIDPSTGQVVATWPAPGYFPGSICFDGKALRVTDLFEKKIYRMDRDTGIFYDEIEMTSPNVTGIAWDGRYLWICDGIEHSISSIDSRDGTTITTFHSPSLNPSGLAWDGRYLWCADRIRDKIYVLDPEEKDVIFSIDAPGKYAWGLAWDGNALWSSDYQEKKFYRIEVRGKDKYSIFKKKDERVTFSSTLRNYGPGKVTSMDFYLALPVEGQTQKFLGDLTLTPAPIETLTDQYGQRVAHYNFKDIPASGEKRVSFSVPCSISGIRYYLYPDETGTLDEIPGDIRSLYLKDAGKYDIHNPYIQNLVKQIVKDEKNPYWIARKLYDYLIAHLEYKLEGGWNTAPAVLKRGTGSCSEYSFSYISLCRAAGIPARYLGTVAIRGDDACYDEVFHRWCEIYLPRFGWVPVDPDRGDETLPADQAEGFGGCRNSFLITTRGGGDSPYLKWSYNCVQSQSFEGKCKVVNEDVAEWEPLPRKKNR